ncbi:hypothetical protein ASPZODRAFT_76410 [Penicilliopsis zonata CBS 506.65]|uniref:AB hydrolase-1 domain-containing protein n=1 Tax=Penicilliopsis zonata CBS 506.65 TaxID=1073090 RepID=A0A1L9S6A7_9EURO|nr:hypothetical protein ASPZODRAFT_76410 [Penicilliopsis zonata CBS 506.65]OJJ42675.1 hypothetical protein ASPZODRAFT_76410 [Penicilliopsis zonata CBS 506.65]
MSFISLQTKPSAQLCYTFTPPSQSSVLLVFLNGLGLPQAAWQPVISQLRTLRNEKRASLPAILTYDRFGQGQTTDRDPRDASVLDPSHGHDCADVVADLHQLILQIKELHLKDDKNTISTVFVANSIGCALARLYAETYPGSVAGVLLLDSVLANSDFVSVFPDPDKKDDTIELPSDVTPDMLRTARDRVARIFHPSVGSREGLSRKTLAGLLPTSDGPVLLGPDGKGPYVTVIGHDPEAFAAESEKMGMPRVLSRAYTNPYWEKYNAGLVQITEPDRARGPFQAPGAGHFVQKDNPGFVVEELDILLDQLD